MIFKNKPVPYLIAEIGVNHNGSLQIAKKLIKHAKINKFNAVKFQTYIPEDLLLKNTPLVNYQKGQKSINNMFSLLKKYQLSFEQFKKLKQYCDKIKIDFLSTPFDTKSAIFLNNLKVPMFKISSTDNDNFLLLKLIKKFKKPILLSLGMIEEEDIKKTIKFLKYKKNMLCIMHCISNYPTQIIDTQLSYINELKKYNYPVGWSDHTLGGVSAYAAIALGAQVIEKHITLSNKMAGPDHKASMCVKELNKFTSNIFDIYKSVNNHGKRKIDKSENLVRKMAKRSLYFSKNLKKGEKISSNHLKALRPRGNGLSPNQISKILGKEVKESVKKNNLLKLSQFK